MGVLSTGLWCKTCEVFEDPDNMEGLRCLGCGCSVSQHANVSVVEGHVATDWQEAAVTFSNDYHAELERRIQAEARVGEVIERVEALERELAICERVSQRNADAHMAAMREVRRLTEATP